MNALSRSALAALTLACVLALPGAHAQSYQPGDVYLQVVLNSPFAAARISKLSRATNVTSTFVDLSGTGAPVHGIGTMAWDPSRKTLVAVYRATSNVAPSIVSVRPDGSIVDLTGPIGQRYGLSPARNGRIYCWLAGVGLQYMDADGSMHTLLNAASSLPYQHDPVLGNVADALTYDQGTNALFTAVWRGTPNACNGGAPGLVVKKLSLDAAGIAVVQTECTTFTLQPSGGQGWPVAWTRLPGGKLVLVTTGDQSTNDAYPRLFQVDPETLAVGTYASPGFPGAAVIGAGAWSWAEQRVMTLDTVVDSLRSFGKGQSGLGSPIRSVQLDVASGWWNIVEVPPPVVSFPQGPTGGYTNLGSYLPAAAQPLVLSGGLDEQSGRVELRLEGGATGALAWLSVADGGSTERVALLGPVALGSGTGELWERLLAPRLAVLGTLAPRALQLRALVLGSDGGLRASDALLLEVE